jgi:anti-sigma regulatory factor (Ser/Thr protein kinase)
MQQVAHYAHPRHPAPPEHLPPGQPPGHLAPDHLPHTGLLPEPSSLTASGRTAHPSALRADGWPCTDELSSAGLPQFLLPGAQPPTTRRAWLDRGQAAAKAREFTRHVLRSWGLGVLAEDATLIVSELVTNGMRHGVMEPDTAGQGVELILCRRVGLIACAVLDPEPEATPLLTHADPAAEGGRGLLVIEALSAAWGWTRLRGCEKAVWATLQVPHTDLVGAGPVLPAAEASTEPGMRASLPPDPRLPARSPHARLRPVFITFSPHCRLRPLSKP